jgi:hypothetical protein
LTSVLALTPGPPGSPPANDGFLTLAEIYELDLKGCELAILSACQTNFGPEQRGEGVVALSRGFLAAGARRVLASNWLVDDEAAASLKGVPDSAEGPVVKAPRWLGKVSRKGAKTQRRESHWVETGLADPGTHLWVPLPRPTFGSRSTFGWCPERGERTPAS